MVIVSIQEECCSTAWIKQKLSANFRHLVRLLRHCHSPQAKSQADNLVCYCTCAYQTQKYYQVLTIVSFMCTYLHDTNFSDERQKHLRILIVWQILLYQYRPEGSNYPRAQQQAIYNIIMGLYGCAIETNVRRGPTSKL